MIMVGKNIPEGYEYSNYLKRHMPTAAVPSDDTYFRRRGGKTHNSFKHIPNFPELQHGEFRGHVNVV